MSSEGEAIRLAAMLAQPAVSLGEQQLDVADLVLLGVLRGEWLRFELDLARRLDLEADGGHVVSAEELRGAATAFRYARGLVSAADFTAWLGDRALSLADLSGVLRRRLLDERVTEVVARRATQAELARVLRAEVLCAGVLAALAEAGSQRLAAAHRLGGVGLAGASAGGPERGVERALAEALTLHASGLAALGADDLVRRLRRLVGLEAALAQLRERVADRVAVERTLANHRLDWLRLTGQQLSLEREGAAREARMLLCEDGLEPSEAARRAGVRSRERSMYLEAVPAELTGTFAAAARGEPVGPWLQDGQWHLLVLDSKTLPTAQDPVLCERAQEEIVADVLERHAAGRREQHCVL